MLDTSLNTQKLYKGIQTAKNNLSELPSQTNISKNQTQKNNVYFMGSSESLAFASNFKAGLNLNNKLIAFKGTDDENNDSNDNETTPEQSKTDKIIPTTILAALLFAGTRLFTIDYIHQNDFNDALKASIEQPHAQSKNPQRTPQNTQPKNQTQTNKRKAILPGYRPILRNDDPNPYSIGNYERDIRQRDEIGICRDKETQEQCNQRVLDAFLQLDRQNSAIERSREIREKANESQKKILEEHADRVRSEQERRESEIRIRRAERMFK